MSRLDEIARRQEDINRQMKDIEAALQAAQTPEQRKELEEQLKRLRENQEELLRDTDELLERMQAAQNSNTTPQSEAMQQAEQQVSQAREEIRQAAESLSQSQPSPSQALSSGTRAEKQIEETRDQLRQQSSARFEESMKSMLTKARELEKEQKALADQTLGRDKNDASPQATKSVHRRIATEKRADGKSANKSQAGREKGSGKALDNQEPAEDPDALRPLQVCGIPRMANPLRPAIAMMLSPINGSNSKNFSKRCNARLPMPNRANLFWRNNSTRLSVRPTTRYRKSLEPGSAIGRTGLGCPGGTDSRGNRSRYSRTARRSRASAEKVLGSEVDALRRALSELENLEKQLQEEINARDPKAASPTQDVTSSEPSDKPSSPNATNRHRIGHPHPLRNLRTRLNRRTRRHHPVRHHPNHLHPIRNRLTLLSGVLHPPSQPGRHRIRALLIRMRLIQTPRIPGRRIRLRARLVGAEEALPILWNEVQLRSPETILENGPMP